MTYLDIKSSTKDNDSLRLLVFKLSKFDQDDGDGQTMYFGGNTEKENDTDYEGFKGRSESYEHYDHEHVEAEVPFAPLDPSRQSSKKVQFQDKNFPGLKPSESIQEDDDEQDQNHNSQGSKMSSRNPSSIGNIQAPTPAPREDSKSSKKSAAKSSKKSDAIQSSKI